MLKSLVYGYYCPETTTMQDKIYFTDKQFWVF